VFATEFIIYRRSFGGPFEFRLPCVTLPSNIEQLLAQRVGGEDPLWQLCTPCSDGWLLRTVLYTDKEQQCGLPVLKRETIIILSSDEEANDARQWQVAELDNSYISSVSLAIGECVSYICISFHNIFTYLINLSILSIQIVRNMCTTLRARRAAAPMLSSSYS
jgi:hypothetical protein